MRFVPHRAENAIVLASFVCEFISPLNDQKLQAIGNLYPKFKDDLPQKLERPGVSFRVGPSLAEKPQAMQSIAAIAFSSYTKSGELEAQFSATPIALAYNCMDYSRWAQVWGKAKTYLDAALEIIGDVEIQAFGLHYHDRFQLEMGEGEKVDFSALLKVGGKYVVPRIFDLTDLWHSHHGSIQEVSEPYPHTRNDNVNLGFLRRPDLPDPQLAVEVTLQHRRVLTPPIAARAARNYLEVFFKEMHECDKEVLRDILSDDVAKQIKLRE